jgi:hypothetical protein
VQWDLFFFFFSAVRTCVFLSIYNGMATSKGCHRTEYQN